MTKGFKDHGKPKRVFFYLYLNKRMLTFIGAVLFSAILLNSCLETGPTWSGFWQYSISNLEDQDTCSGNLKLTVYSEETLLHDSIKVSKGEYSSETNPIPKDFVKGTPIKIEAWCLSEADQEQSYLLFESPLRGGEKASGIQLTDRMKTDDCLIPKEFRGKKLCVRSRLFDG